MITYAKATRRPPQISRRTMKRRRSQGSKRLPYTKGAWTYQYSPYLSRFDEEIPAFEIHGEHKVCDTNEDRPLAEQEANAMLIAAAPDLLEAAEQVIANWEQGDLAAAVRWLDAAVMLAKGRAS